MRITNRKYSDYKVENHLVYKSHLKSEWEAIKEWE